MHLYFCEKVFEVLNPKVLKALKYQTKYSEYAYERKK